MASPEVTPPHRSSYGQPLPISPGYQRRTSTALMSPVSPPISYGSYSSSYTMSMKSPYRRPSTFSVNYQDEEEDHDGPALDIQRAYRRQSRRRDSRRISISQAPPLQAIETLQDDPTLEGAPDEFPMPEPPGRSLRDLLLLGALVFGTQYCFATETAFATPILLKVGLPDQLYSLNWFLGPVIGFLFQPLIGTFSDRCTCSWGRRRPFILALCVGILIGLSLVLNGADLGKLVQNSSSYTVWSIVFTIVGVVVMDFTADSVDCPHRAYIVDVCNSNDIERGMNIRALLTGLGGGIGYVIGGIDWTKTPLGPAFGNSQVRVIYVINMAVCLVTFTLTLFSVKETPLKKVKSSERTPEDEKALLFNGNVEKEGSGISTSYGSVGHVDGIAKHGGSAFDDVSLSPSSDNSVPVESLADTSTLALLKSIAKMPKELAFLCINHFLGELAYLTVLLFFTDYMGQVVYKGDPSQPEDSHAHKLYDEGVKMGCWGMCIFAFSAAIYSLVLDRLILKCQLRTLYVGGELIFAVGTGLQAIFTDSVPATLALCATYGVMYSTIATLPFIILARFHENEDYVNRGSVQRGLATDTACLQCQLFLAQILLSAVLGPIASAAGTHLTTVFIASGAGFVAAFFSALFVIYEVRPRPMPLYQQT
ncbi:membrane-associated transporter protein-like [Ptychodera flava]|uniref:membrane-associated transporter protein-like n=1 Tax=Ptychodera flava TaxID=63121 RepID=UPI003969F6C8